MESARQFYDREQPLYEGEEWIGMVRAILPEENERRFNQGQLFDLRTEYLCITNQGRFSNQLPYHDWLIPRLNMAITNFRLDNDNRHFGMPRRVGDFIQFNSGETLFTAGDVRFRRFCYEHMYGLLGSMLGYDYRNHDMTGVTLWTCDRLWRKKKLALLAHQIKYLHDHMDSNYVVTSLEDHKILLGMRRRKRANYVLQLIESPRFPLNADILDHVHSFLEGDLVETSTWTTSVWYTKNISQKVSLGHFGETVVEVEGIGIWRPSDYSPQLAVVTSIVDLDLYDHLANLPGF